MFFDNFKIEITRNEIKGPIFRRRYKSYNTFKKIVQLQFYVQIYKKKKKLKNFYLYKQNLPSEKEKKIYSKNIC